MASQPQSSGMNSSGKSLVSAQPFGRVYQWLFARGGHLKDQVVRGSIWLVLGDVAARAASVLKLAVLGRLLSPHDFGLMGIAMVLLRGVEYFTETGFKAGLIQKAGDIRPYLNSAWTVRILRALVVTLVMVLGAPLGAWFFENTEATQVIRCVGLVTMIYGFSNPAVVYLRRELDFQREVRWKLTGVIAGLVVGVLVALAYRNVWALVASVVAAAAAETVASYWVKPYRPRLEFDWDRARELYEFGKWVFWFNIIGFLSLYTDSAAAGKILGATALGFYQMANQLTKYPTTQVATHIGGVMFPTFSKLRSLSDVRRVFLRTLTALTWVIIPVGCFLSIFARPLVMLILGPKWISITSAFQILAWAGAASAFVAVVDPLFMGIGQPKLATQASFFRVVILGIFIYPLTKGFGISGVALALTLSAIGAAAYQFLLVARVIHVDGREVARAFKGGVVGSLPFLAWALLPLPRTLWIQLGGAALSGGVYLALLAPTLRTLLKSRPASEAAIETSPQGA
jgi:lipopolysaccharide exporter